MLDLFTSNGHGAPLTLGIALFQSTPKLVYRHIEVVQLDPNKKRLGSKSLFVSIGSQPEARLQDHALSE